MGEAANIACLRLFKAVVLQVRSLRVCIEAKVTNHKQTLVVIHHASLFPNILLNTVWGNANGCRKVPKLSLTMYPLGISTYEQEFLITKS